MSARLLRGLSTVLIVAGVALLADVVATLLWQEPITALIALRHQHQLAAELATLEARGPTALELAELRGLPDPHRQIAVLARSVRRRVPRGAAVGRLFIPRLGKSLVVVNGSDAASLRGGPGIYDETPFPGATQTTAIAGHRTTYLAPFRQVDQLRRGDAIELRMPYAAFHYTVQYTRTVLPERALDSPRPRLRPPRPVRLSPLFSASHRIVVFARLAGVVPNGSFVRHHAVAVKLGVGNAPMITGPVCGPSDRRRCREESDASSGAEVACAPRRVRRGPGQGHRGRAVPCPPARHPGGQTRVPIPGKRLLPAAVVERESGLARDDPPHDHDVGGRRLRRRPPRRSSS